MILSTPSAHSNPTDSSTPEGALDLQTRFGDMMVVNQGNNESSDANLLLEDPPVSTSSDGGLIYTIKIATSTEIPLVDMLLTETQSGKLVNILDFSGLEFAGLKLDSLSNLTADIVLHSNLAILEKSVIQEGVNLMYHIPT